jgi:hypothetical protein
MSRPQRRQSRGIGYLVRRGAPQCGHRQNRKLTYTPAIAMIIGGRKSHTVWRLISSFAGVLGCVSARNNAQMTNKRPPPPIRSQIWRDTRRRWEATNTTRDQSIGSNNGLTSKSSAAAVASTSREHCLRCHQCANQPRGVEHAGGSLSQTVLRIE